MTNQNFNKRFTPLEQMALQATRAVGSTTSLILHTAFFLCCFALMLFGWDVDRILLVLTTLVSLEAIYLSIFIQLTVNMNTRWLSEVSQDVEEIQENVEEISEDIEDIQEDVEEISEDIEDIQEDVEDIQQEETDGETKLPEKTELS